MEVPVAVVGNGPVGQTAALLLARWGVPSTLLDARPRRDAVGSKAIVQQRDVLDVWESVGAGRRIAAEGLTWTTARTFHRDRELFGYTFAEAGRPAFPPFVNISQSRTERLLDESIAAAPPVDYDDRREAASGARDARIRAVIGDRPYEVVWGSVYRFHSRVVDRMRIGRVLLAGDVAHLVSPFGARGLNSGVQDAENAAWKLAFTLNGWAGGDLLDSYHAERHAAALENLDVTGATMRFLVPGTEAERRHRLLTLEAAVTDPAARAAVDSGRLAEPFWYADSPLTTPDPARPFAGRPPRGAVPPAGPGVIVPDAPIRLPGAGVTRLREVARDGFLLLAAEGVDGDRVRRAARHATRAPVRLLRLADVDRTGALARALTARPGEVWLIRPDAHIAAVLADPTPPAVTAAVRRALALRTPAAS